MKKKLLVILVCTLMIASATILITPEHYQVKAASGESSVGDENGVGINTSYICYIADNLSWIGKTHERGRSFGTDGEYHASILIENQMNQIGLYEVNTDEIKGTAQHPDLNATLEVVSKGILINGTQSVTDCYITPRWNTTFISLLDPDLAENTSLLTYNFSYENLPVYRKPNFSAFDELFSDCLFLEYLQENMTLHLVYNIPTFVNFCLKQLARYFNITYENINVSDPNTLPSWLNESLQEPKCIGPYLLIEEDPSYNPNAFFPSGLVEFEPLSIPRAIYHTLKLIIEMSFWNLTRQNCMGLIRYDFNNDTYDMTNGLLMARSILYINGSVGRPIYENATLLTPSNREISFWLNQSYNPSVKSYNVIGQINGTNPNKTVLVDCLYDSWWNQGTADAAIGMGTVLALGKYFKDNNITPKYNLKFVAFGGEEYGFLGAQHYNDTHTNENITTVIDLNQIGFSQTGPLPQTMFVHTNNESLMSLLRCITNDTHYEERTGTPFLHIGYTYYGGPSDDQPFAIACLPYKGNRSLNTICFLKDMNWTLHHRDGRNHDLGDVMTYYNETDINVTSEMIWNITKYFTVDPNCWFSNVSFTAFDSPNDGDALNDSIRANFTIHSGLPNDKVRVVINLSYEVDGTEGNISNAGSADYTLTSQCKNESYVFTIPDFFTNGNFSVSFDLYNSTGRINRIVYGSSDYNDTTGFSNWFHLYHPLGYVNVGNKTKYVYDNISGSVFTANEDGRADNIIALIDQQSNAGPYTCMLYRASDATLIGTTTSEWVSLPRGSGYSSSCWWAVFNFTGTKPLLEKGTQYVITCWGDSATSLILYNESSFSGKGRYDNQTYGTPPNPADFTNESRYYSIYCSYTPDIIPPQITDVIVSPDTVGFGYNVTITSNVTDNRSDVNLVKVRIGEPGGRQSNNTMTHISGDLYRYIFTNTWIVGQYNYSIWAQDNETNSNTSTTYYFHVSANASISIATLRNTYSGSQYINITDPPNPPENLTVVDRGLTWNTYYNATSGENILETYQGPVNYPEDNGTWTPINNTLAPLGSNHPAYVYGYRQGNDHGLYGVYFKSNVQQEWPVAFAYNKSDDPTVHAVRSKLVGVGYVDPQSNWAYQYLQNVQSSQGQTNGYSITYPGVFTGTDVTWGYGNTGLKEAITLSNTTKTVLQNHPPSQYGLNDASSYLVFITKLDYQNLNLYNGSGLLNGNITISDTGIDLRDVLGQFKCALPLGEAYELNNELVRQKLTYRIIHLNGNTLLLSGLKLSDLIAMTFPVVIDPTLTVYTTTSDGFISKTSGSYNTAWTASSGTISDSASYLSIGQKKDPAAPPSLTYTIYRGFVFFNTTVLPSNACLDNATLSVYKKDDYSSTDFDITIQNGQPTYPHNPLQTSDYRKSVYSGNGGALNTSRFSSGYNAIRLNDLAWINKTGVTKLCLRSSRDINGNAPTGNEYINVYSNEFLGMYPPKLVINYRNQSKIKNAGSTDIKGYLLVQIQFYNSTQGKWLLDDDTINETTTRTITSGNQLALDTIFNGLVRASDLTHGTGTYRVYAAFRDPEGNILRTNDERELEAWREFSKT